MDNEITDLLNQAGIRLAYSLNLDKPAHYISQLKIILLRSNLTDQEQKSAILHELGHALQHSGFAETYWKTYAAHVKMEADAEEFKIKHLLNDYLNNPENDIDDFNSCHFIEDEKIDFRFEPFVRTWYKQYCAVGNLI